MNALVPHTNGEAFRASTDAAGLCKAIVVQTAMEIQGRRYVRVEGWQAVAVAHGCTASARAVEALADGVRAIGEVRRMSDGVVIAEAEGFVGCDEPTWFGGEVTDRWGKTKMLPKRADYAIRAMAQTRAISRACRSAFAHVVVMMNAGLETTPAEEVPLEGFQDRQEAPRDVTPAKATTTDENGLKRSPDGRLIPAEAKRQKIHEPLVARIDAADWPELDKIEDEFDDLTKDHPAKWLDGYRDRIEIRRRELTPAAPDWDAREEATTEPDDADDFPGDRRPAAEPEPVPV